MCDESDDENTFQINCVNLSSRDKKDRRAISEVMAKCPVEAWRSFKAIKLDIKRTNHTSLISLMKRFPFEEVTQMMLEENVLRDEHLKSCNECNSVVINRRTLYVKYGTKPRDVNFENCIELRKLAIDFDDDSWQTKIDKFIVANFSEACKQKKVKFIRSLNTDDIFNFARATERSCKKVEFNAIVKWLRVNLERHRCFAELVSDEDNKRPFETSLRRLCELENDTKWGWFGARSRIRSSPPVWLISNDNFGIVRYLSQQPQCETTLEQADTFILKHLSELPESADLVNLPVEAIEKYASDEKFYKGGDSIWTLIKNWLKQRSDVTLAQRSQILASMHIAKLSNAALGGYGKHVIVRNSVACQANLIDVVFTKFMEIEKSILSLQRQLSDTDEKLHNMTRAMTELRQILAKDEEWKNHVNSRLKNQDDLFKQMENRLTQLQHDSRTCYLESRLSRVEESLHSSKKLNENHDVDRFTSIEEQLTEMLLRLEKLEKRHIQTEQQIGVSAISDPEARLNLQESCGILSNERLKQTCETKGCRVVRERSSYPPRSPRDPGARRASLPGRLQRTGMIL